MNCLQKITALITRFNNFQVRGYAIAKPIPIEWVRPEIIPPYDRRKSGDGGIEFSVSLKDVLLDYEKSKELETASEEVKKLFTAEFHNLRKFKMKKQEEVVKVVKRHIKDTGSMECRIGRLTVNILHLQEEFKKHPYNGDLKRFLIETIDKRKKWLKKLRLQDYRKFEYLLQKLNLEYHPPVEKFYYITRKSAHIKLLGKWCDNLRQKKLDAYRAELESQQKQFFEDKLQKLIFIRNEEIACGLKPTVSEAEIEAAENKAAEFA